MSTVTLADLPMNRALDHRAMASIRGAAGAPWVFGAFRAFQPESARIAPIFNFYEINFVADQLNVQFQTINVENRAANSVVNVNAAQTAQNLNFAVSAS